MNQLPLPGEHLVRLCGDTLRFELTMPTIGKGDCAYVRTNLGAAEIRRRRVIAEVEGIRGEILNEWQDIPMTLREDLSGFVCELPMNEVGDFEAKCTLIPGNGGSQQWVDGDNIHITVEPSQTAGNNTIYNAFIRQFGRNCSHRTTSAGILEAEKLLDNGNYTVVPPSGHFRDFLKKLPHVMGDLGFRIIQLLPVQPPPMAYGRMGRFGSPFAPTEYMVVDPSLAEFDRKCTPMEQFREVLDGVHSQDGLVLLDLPIDHTGWASSIQVHFPEWFCREADNSFTSPGAWGVVWEDLCKLDFSHRELWKFLADVFLHWTKMGVDGFRCDAGYMIPRNVWDYITCKVREQYPDTIFFLEGLGGSPAVTCDLLEHAGMNWAYSELFQVFGSDAIKSYLSNAFQISEHNGLAVNFAETHDNERLALKGAVWSKMRVVLSALTAPNGAFGMANGVEWLATEKIDVHGDSSLNWGASPNLIDVIHRLTDILRVHPAFHNGARMRICGSGSAVGVLRTTDKAEESVLIVLNADERQGAWLEWADGEFSVAEVNEILNGKNVNIVSHSKDRWHLDVPPGECYCLSHRSLDFFAASEYQDVNEHQRMREMAVKILVALHGYQDVSSLDVEKGVKMLRQSPLAFMHLLVRRGQDDDSRLPPVVIWNLEKDSRRIVSVPAGYFLGIGAKSPFRVRIVDDAGKCVRRVSSCMGDKGKYGAILEPLPVASDEPQKYTIQVEAYSDYHAERLTGRIVQMPKKTPRISLTVPQDGLLTTQCGLCTNLRGGYAMCRARFGELHSKYDAMMAAGLSPVCPEDRIVALSRCRIWVEFHGFVSELTPACQELFESGYDNAMRWTFVVSAGLGQTLRIRVMLQLDTECNCGRLVVERLPEQGGSYELHDIMPVTLRIRPDVDWRTNHEVTQAYSGAENAFRSSVVATNEGFDFCPWNSVGFQMNATRGVFRQDPQWVYQVYLDEDAQRALSCKTDIFSPGEFRCQLAGGKAQCLEFGIIGEEVNEFPEVEFKADCSLKDGLKQALSMYLANRDGNRTVIAGFPWFLDWGRDTFIALRGLIAAGRVKESRAILRVFAKFEEKGTIPNMIHGEDSGDRATSDAPLWLFVGTRELQQLQGKKLLDMDCGGRTLLAVLESIAQNIHKGVSNGVHCDPESLLVFSPSHYTWMDTNYPAGTPREGYPVEIQALWMHALQFLYDQTGKACYNEWLKTVKKNFLELFVCKDGSGLVDCLHGDATTPARKAVADDCVRPNQLLVITLCPGVLSSDCIQEILFECQVLLIPGGIRSLDDEAVTVPQPVTDHGRLLNNPQRPYWGHYEGDENTRRKIAYHNGTAWGWQMPLYAEALWFAYGDQVRDAARALMGQVTLQMKRHCLGHIPEIYDGDAPHTGRGCYAQAWSVSEYYRVLSLL